MSNAPSTETSTVFFGVHLVNTKVITFEQLKMAMAYQQYRNFKFGDEAVACGLLTEEQVKTALLLQRRKDIKIVPRNCRVRQTGRGWHAEESGGWCRPRTPLPAAQATGWQDARSPECASPALQRH